MEEDYTKSAEEDDNKSAEEDYIKSMEEDDNKSAEEDDNKSVESVESNGKWEDVSNKSDSLEISDIDSDEMDFDRNEIENILRDTIGNDVKVLKSDCSFSDISESSTDSNCLKYA